jgi:hypothetical protein
LCYTVVQDEAARTQADILSRTDNRIFAETDLRDNLANELATLQSCLHEAKEDAEGQLVSIQLRIGCQYMHCSQLMVVEDSPGQVLSRALTSLKFVKPS